MPSFFAYICSVKHLKLNKTMKKLLIAFSALFACLACTESPDVDQLAPNQRNVTIIAKTDISRASYDPNTMSTRWEATDIIGCFAGNKYVIGIYYSFRNNVFEGSA